MHTLALRASPQRDDIPQHVGVITVFEIEVREEEKNEGPSTTLRKPGQAPSLRVGHIPEVICLRVGLTLGGQRHEFMTVGSAIGMSGCWVFFAGTRWTV